MKKRTCMILALLLCVLVLLSGGCAIGDLTGKDTYEGKPLYQFDVENNTVEIDGVMYRAVWEIPLDTISIGEKIGFLWEKLNFEIEDGVVYRIALIEEYPDKEYLHAKSYTYYEVDGIKRLYEINLKKVE